MVKNRYITTKTTKKIILRVIAKQDFINKIEHNIINKQPN
jgi:hypothetical protein